MKPLMQEEVVNAVSDESVPPAEMVSDEQHGTSGSIHAAIKPDIAEMSFQAVP
jgi:hypothetical protein